MTELFGLTNGIRIILEKQDYLKTASIGIWVHVGSAHETKENNGISHVIEHMLFKGTKTRTTKDIADVIARIGDDVNAYTSKEYTSFYGTTLTEYIPTMIELFGDMLLNSSIDEVLLEREKDVIMDEIDMYFDSPDDLVHEKVQYESWYPNPLSFYISGSRETVKPINATQVKEFMKAHYVAEQIIISVAGNYPDTIIEQLEAAFGRISKGSSVSLPYEAPVFKPVFTSIIKDTEQTHINLAFECVNITAKENYTVSVMNSMLGGSNNSRLFQVIREELGLAYSIYSYHCAYEAAGLFQIDLIVNPNQSVSVLNKMLSILEEFLEGGITEEELLTHKNQMVTELIMSNETAKARMNNNAKSVLTHGFVQTTEQLIEKVKAVTKEDILSFAQTYLTKEKCSICVIGPKKGSHIDKLKKAFQ